MTEHLEVLQNAIFENSEKMENGVYLELMNLTKKIFEGLDKQKKQDPNAYLKFILTKSPRFYLLGCINRNYHKTLDLYDTKGFFINSYIEGSILRLLCENNKFLFMRIKKINSHSLRYDIIKFKVKYDIPPEQRKKPKIRRNLLLNFKVAPSNSLEQKFFYIFEEDKNETFKIYNELKKICMSEEKDFINCEDLDHKKFLNI